MHFFVTGTHQFSLFFFLLEKCFLLEQKLKTKSLKKIKNKLNKYTYTSTEDTKHLQKNYLNLKLSNS